MLRARRLLMSVVVLCALAAAVVANILLPRIWSASSEVYIDYRDSDPTGVRSLSPQLDSSYLQTQINLIQSQVVAERVISNMRLRDSSAFLATVERHGISRANAQLLTNLLDNISVSHAGDSRVLNISYSARTPAAARDFANATVQAYFEVSQDLMSNAARSRREQYTAQLEELRREAELLHEKITQYRQESGILLVENGRHPELRRLEDLNDALLQLQAKRIEAASRITAIERALATGFEIEDFPEVGRLPQMIELRAQLNAATARLQEARTTMGANHPKVAALNKEIGTFQSAIQREMRAALASQTRELPMLEAQEAALQEQIEEQRTRVATELAHQDRVASYQRQLNSVEQVYNAALQKYDEMLMASNIVPPNFTVLRQAELPATPSRPRPMANLAASLIIGLILAVSLALLLELLRRRVRCVDDVVRTSNVPLLGVVGAAHDASTPQASTP